MINNLDWFLHFNKAIIGEIKQCHTHAIKLIALLINRKTTQLSTAYNGYCDNSFKWQDVLAYSERIKLKTRLYIAVGLIYYFNVHD